jgi:hypothetical protein
MPALIRKGLTEVTEAQIDTVEMYFQKFPLHALYYIQIATFILFILKKNSVVDVVTHLMDNALLLLEIG